MDNIYTIIIVIKMIKAVTELKAWYASSFYFKLLYMIEYGDRQVSEACGLKPRICTWETHIDTHTKLILKKKIYIKWGSMP